MSKLRSAREAAVLRHLRLIRVAVVAAFFGIVLAACAGGSTGSRFQPAAADIKRSSDTFTVLYDFQGGPSGGAGPDAIVQVPGGGLLGTTYEGGHIHPRDCETTGCGTIFQFNGSNARLIYLFQPQPSGFHPTGSLLLHDGVYYGVAQGGAHDDGIVFSLNHTTGSAWIVKTLYNFNGAPNDGFEPSGLIYISARGTIVGTTRMGGSGTGCLFSTDGCGTVFELQPPATTGGTWKESILHSFRGPDGAGPGGYAVRRGGSFYGTTEFGGAGLCPAVLGCGTIYKLTPSAGGATERVVHSFYTSSSSTDGVWVSGALVDGGDGNLYGTTLFGGGAPACEVEPQVYGCGTFYSVSFGRGEKPQVTTQYAFAGGSDAESPGELAAASSGLYGSSTYGGSTACYDGCGIVFHFTRSGTAWTETQLHVFKGPDGKGPDGPILLDGSKLYGTAAAGGSAACSCGTIFELGI
jgi:uncharacterized repeat protein (TIGR03803 family)